jgi:catechol 2,3-dioxygenase-like lactoylglutathione lyase family enzyme
VIDHVSFAVSRSQAESCAGFYELLGFVRVEPPAGLGARSIWLQSARGAIHLMFVDRDGVEVPASAASGGGHVALVVDDFVAGVEALRRLGVAVEPRTAYWGAERAYVRDPAGNLIELMAAAPEVKLGE